MNIKMILFNSTEVSFSVLAVLINNKHIRARNHIHKPIIYLMYVTRFINELQYAQHRHRMMKQLRP